MNLNGKTISCNLFVSIEDKIKEYLFSFNSYNSLVDVKLYDLNDDNNEYYQLSFSDFFDYRENINNFEFALFELKSDLSYFIVSTPKFIINERNIDNKFIKKFNLNHLIIMHIMKLEV